MPIAFGLLSTGRKIVLNFLPINNKADEKSCNFWNDKRIKCNIIEHLVSSITGGIVRWLKKSSNETCLTWSHMHLILKWLKIRTIHFSLISSSKYWSHVFWPKWLTFLARKCWSGSKFEEKLNSRQKWFEFWATSTFSS